MKDKIKEYLDGNWYQLLNEEQTEIIAERIERLILHTERPTKQNYHDCIHAVVLTCNPPKDGCARFIYPKDCATCKEFLPRSPPVTRFQRD